MNSKVHHLGAKAVDDKYNELNFQETGIGCGQDFILTRNIKAFLSHYY